METNRYLKRTLPNIPNHPTQIISNIHRQPLSGWVHWGCYAAVLLSVFLHFDLASFSRLLTRVKLREKYFLGI